MCISACIWAEIDTVVFGASTLEDADLVLATSVRPTAAGAGGSHAARAKVSIDT